MDKDEKEKQVQNILRLVRQRKRLKNELEGLDEYQEKINKARKKYGKDV